MDKSAYELMLETALQTAQSENLALKERVQRLESQAGFNRVKLAKAAKDLAIARQLTLTPEA